MRPTRLEPDPPSQAEPPPQVQSAPVPAVSENPDGEIDSLVIRRSSAAYLPPNTRRATVAFRYFSVLLFLLLALAAAFLWTYLARIKPAISRAGASGVPAARAVEVTPPEHVLEKIDGNSSLIQGLQSQIDAIREAQSQQGAQLTKLIEQVASAPAASAPPPAGGGSAMPAGSSLVESQTSPTQAELRLLKERNRLTGYADEAISTGQRRTLNLIIDAMRDPERANLYHAAQAEYYRVMAHYQFINRINPNYKLPIPELFPGGKVRDEADLETSQIITLLDNKELDWQVRLRAAYLLGGRRTPEVGDALVRALTQDPSLDVAKEAQLSFEQNVGRHFLLFDIAGIEKWWQTQNTVRETKPGTAAAPN